MWDVVFWQHSFLTSGQHEFDIWNSIQKNIVNDLIHESFWKITSIKKCNVEFYFVGRYLWHLCEMSKFHAVHEELMLNLLVLYARWTDMVLKVVESGFSG